MSVMVGVGKGPIRVLINAEALENMNKVNVLITDKTGTITEGETFCRKSIFTENKRNICK
jgi:Cu2+-exporting ATPase